MKRDMDLVREILLSIEDHAHGHVPSTIEINGYSDEQIAYHCFLLDEAGLIVAADTTSDNSLSPSAIPIRLTWSGHEFIGNSRNEDIWRQAKDAVHKIGDVSFSVWASVLANVVSKNLGL